MNELLTATLETLEMTCLSLAFSYVIAIPLGILTNETSKSGLFPNRAINWILNIIIGFGRAVPFTILMVVALPLTRLLVGTGIGTTATVVPLTLAASTVPHAEILNNIKEDVKAEGYELVVKEVTDYVTPNLMLDSGDVDANYFQHEPYLVDFNTKNKTDIVSAFKVHFEPMGIYSLRVKNFAWCTYLAGSSKIVIPNDTSNKERAMKLLNDNIGEFLGNYEIIEAEAQSIPALLNESNIMYACINGNYALSAGITDKCIVTEPVDGETAQRNANLIAVKRENVNKPFVEILRKYLLSEKTKLFIQSRYGSAVKVVF